MSTRIIAVLALLAGCDGGVSGAGLDGGAAEAGLEAPAPASPLSAGLEAVDFGCVVTGQPVAYRVQIDNTALASVGPLEVRLSPSTAMLSILVDGCSGLTLGANEACLVSIFFMAPTALDAEATLEVTAEGVAPLRLPVRARTRDGC